VAAETTEEDIAPGPFGHTAGDIDDLERRETRPDTRDGVGRLAEHDDAVRGDRRGRR
jgi:hypothetical protein